MLLSTTANQTVAPAPDLPGNDPTPAPLASPAEAVSLLFPSDAGGVGYLFDHGLANAVPTPLESVPVTSPDLGAAAMSSVNEGVNAHVSAMPQVPTPVAGGAVDVPLAEPAVPAAQSSTLRQTLTQEGNRLKTFLAGLGGSSNGPAGG
jgi:hypothetical protein